MTTKTISTYIAAGYTLRTGYPLYYSGLTITSTGGVGGTGLFIPGGYSFTTLSNAGTINQTKGGTAYGAYISGGILLATGATVINQQTGFIGGDNGVILYGGGSVKNYGTISATNSAIVFYYIGGTVTNGSYLDQTALIQGKDVTFGAGGSGGAGAVANFGTIKAEVVMDSGGTITNGIYTDLNARIEGDTGIYIAGAATVTNYGTIAGTGAGSGARGVQAGGYYAGSITLTNGTIIDPTALIEGYGGVSVSGGAGTIANYGTIRATYIYGNGVELHGGGSLANGASGAVNNAKALIEGYSGVVLGGVATVTNFGTILGFGHGNASGAYGGAGVYIDSGAVTNGASGQAGAFISGYRGVVALGDATVTNFGTIHGVGGTAVQFSSSSDVLVVEAGCAFEGAVMGAGGTLDLDTGTGTLKGLLAGGNVTVSGSMAKTTFTNFGTVEIGAAAQFKLKGAGTIGAGQTLIDAGSLSVGKTLTVSGDLVASGKLKGGGTLALTAGGAAFDAGASLTVSHVTVSGTAAVSVATNLTYAGQWTQSAGTVSVASGDTLTFTGTGNTLSGTLTGAGTVALTQGSSAFNAGAALTVAKITVAGSATAVSVGANLTYAGQWTQSAGTVSVASGDTLTFTGTGNTLSGTLTGAGTVALVGGSDTLSGVSLTAAGVTINGAAATLSGTITNSGKISVTSPSIIVSAAGAVLAGGGTVALSNNATNKITGAVGAATLTNLDNTLSGAGALGGGSMTLNNQAEGVINANASKALTIDTGAAAVVNAGLIKASGAGGLTIASAVTNTGTLSAAGGNLTVNGAVTGTGKGVISGGTLNFTSSFSEDVTFSGATGILELAQSKNYKGSISGFSKTGGTSLDLVDIAFTGAGEATFSGTATSGVLKVTDGVHTAKITLIGDYTASTFVAASDGHGGVIIHDPAGAVAALPPWIVPGSGQRFIAAMAGWGDSGGAALGPGTSEPWRIAHPLLASPRMHFA